MFLVSGPGAQDLFCVNNGPLRGSYQRAPGPSGKTLSSFAFSLGVPVGKLHPQCQVVLLVKEVVQSSQNIHPRVNLVIRWLSAVQVVDDVETNITDDCRIYIEFLL